MAINIAYMDYYVPSDELSTDVIIREATALANCPPHIQSEEYAFFVKRILKLTGVRQEQKLTEQQMLSRLLDTLFAMSGYSPPKVGALLIAETQFGDTGALLKSVQRASNFETAYCACIAGNQCANFEVALHMAGALLRADPTLTNVGILGAVKARQMDDRIAGWYALLGDGAGLMIVTRDGTGPQVIEQVITSTGALMGPLAAGEETALNRQHYIGALTKLFERQPQYRGQIAHVVTQNANNVLIAQCLTAFGIPPSRIFNRNAARYGHLHCLDFVVNLKDLVASGAVKAGEVILAIGTGWNGSYAMSLLAA